MEGSTKPRGRRPCFVTEFTQLDPQEGQPASERTEVRVLIDDGPLHVGARFFDDEPERVKARLARRDNPSQSDLFDVWIDSYHDHLTGRHFSVNPVGVMLDGADGADGAEDLFNFRVSRALNNYGFIRMFHSRRIGRSPQRLVRGSNFDFVDAPEQTTIGGAAKVTGKTRGGWSVGVIDALTDHEDARFVDTLGVHRETGVEPLTHYLAGRVKRDFRDGNTVVGGLLTAVDRRLDDVPLKNQLRSGAYTGGLDLNHAWSQRRWAFDAAVSGSSLSGSDRAIGVAQRSSTRYYQRPDHGDYAAYDPTRTSLDGYSMDASVTKVAGNHWQASVAYTSKSPGYELNDIGFQTRADYRALSNIVYYQENTPGKLFRSYYVFPFWNYAWNFGGDKIIEASAVDGGGQLANFWSVDARYTLNARAFDDRLTRGGPQAQLPQGTSWFVNLTSDSRHAWSINPGYTHSANERGGRGESYTLALSARPSSSLRLRFEPSFSKTHALAQYVTTVSDADATASFGNRYVFSTLDRDVLSLVTRVDWTFTPRLSLQLFVQPLVDSGHSSEIKEFVQPCGFMFDRYGRERGSITRNTSGGYTIDPGNGATFDLDDPDYNFRSLLGNAVVRWEYRPGSTLFFVWQQHRDDVEPIGDFSFSRDYEAIFKKAPENVFEVKATWWIGL